MGDEGDETWSAAGRVSGAFLDMVDVIVMKKAEVRSALCSSRGISDRGRSVFDWHGEGGTRGKLSVRS